MGPQSGDLPNWMEWVFCTAQGHAHFLPASTVNKLPKQCGIKVQGVYSRSKPVAVKSPLNYEVLNICALHGFMDCVMILNILRIAKLNVYCRNYELVVYHWARLPAAAELNRIVIAMMKIRWDFPLVRKLNDVDKRGEMVVTSRPLR
ncbi:hypothetical protein SLEP1_g11921 [Rubroshorea leprosula]|nr:hypothetical protein SLEP1_g11921 [Rubroshorea leprosula]